MSRKNFCALQILIVAMLVVASLANTFAWSERGEQSGSKLRLIYASSVNGRTATAETHLVGSENGNGIGTYNVSAGDVLSFETVVNNTGDFPCNVSLLLKVMSDPNEIVTAVPSFRVRLSQPTQEYRDYDSLVIIDDDVAGDVENDVEFEWIRVVPSCQVEADGEITFRWSLEFASEGKFTIGAIVLEHF